MAAVRCPSCGARATWADAATGWAKCGPCDRTFQHVATASSAGADEVARPRLRPVPTAAEARAASREDWFALEASAPETGYREDGARDEERIVVPHPPPSRLAAGSWAGAGLVSLLIGGMCLALSFAVGEPGPGVVLGAPAVLAISAGLWMMRGRPVAPTFARAELCVGRKRIAVSWDEGPVTQLSPVESVHVAPRATSVVILGGLSGEPGGAHVSVRSARGAELLVVRLADRVGLVPERTPDGGLLARPPARPSDAP